jgi:hypothetical protein
MSMRLLPLAKNRGHSVIKQFCGLYAFTSIGHEMHIE